MSIVTCKAKTQNDLTVARIVLEVLCQSLNYRCSVTYNDGKSFDVLIPDGAEDNAIMKFKRLAPDLEYTKSSKSVMAKSQMESNKKIHNYKIKESDEKEELDPEELKKKVDQFIQTHTPEEIAKILGYKFED